MDENTRRRISSNMLIMDNSGELKLTDDQRSARNQLNAGDPNNAFSSNVLNATSAEKTKSTRLSNLSTTIAQGKIINAVLETAINTDLPGTLRAIVSRDVYPESGRSVMIPKGSRLIGVYNTAVTRGQSRVLIIWTRVIRPDGIDIMIGSPGVDSLGRAGVVGVTDNKYAEIFSAAILTSALSIGAATAADALTGDDNSTTRNSDGSSTFTGSAGAEAAAQSVTNIGNIGRSVVGTVLDLRPTITIDQGSRISVFVNRDLSFPTTSSSTQFIE